MAQVQLPWSCLSFPVRDRAAEKEHLEVKVTPVQPGGLGCVGWFDLHGDRVAPLGCVHALVVQLHAGYAPNLNATLRWNAQGGAHLPYHATLIQFTTYSLRCGASDSSDILA